MFVNSPYRYFGDPTGSESEGTSGGGESQSAGESAAGSDSGPSASGGEGGEGGAGIYYNWRNWPTQVELPSGRAYNLGPRGEKVYLDTLEFISPPGIPEALAPEGTIKWVSTIKKKKKKKKTSVTEIKSMTGELPKEGVINVPNPTAVPTSIPTITPTVREAGFSPVLMILLAGAAGFFLLKKVRG